MAIVRTYLCGDCGTKFDKLHFNASEPAPECPGCTELASKQVPAGFAIGGNASKAGDIAQDILEKDYGMSDIKDRQREGDISAVTPPAVQAQVQKFWAPGNDVIGAAKLGAAAARADGRNPLSMVQRVGKQYGSSRVICKPVNNG